MAIKQNQGFRLDLRLAENVEDDAAWDNLYQPGIAKDIAVLKNNIRNTSTAGFSSCTTNDDNDLRYPVGIAVSFFSFLQSDGTPRNTIYTNDDVVGVSHTVTFPSSDSTTVQLTPGIDYYVCTSNGRNSFKLSTTRSTYITGFSTVHILGHPTIVDTPDGGSSTSSGEITQNYEGEGTKVKTPWNFIRKDPVYKGNLINFIEPEKLDDTFYFLGSGGLNGTFESNVNSFEYSEYSILKKYKTNESVTGNRDIKFEGSVRVKDDATQNITQCALNKINEDGTPDSAGIFIGNTRAFSTDNNPWTKDTATSSTKTESDQITIGDLEFDGKIEIDGLRTSGTGIELESVTVSDFSTELDSSLVVANTHNVYKFPMIINGETYYILVDKL